MNWMLHGDWLPEMARSHYTCLLGITRCIPQEITFFFYIKNLLLIRLVWSRWLDIGLILFVCVFEDLDSISAINTPKKNLANKYPVIKTLCLVSFSYIPAHSQFPVDRTYLDAWQSFFCPASYFLYIQHRYNIMKKIYINKLWFHDTVQTRFI